MPCSVALPLDAPQSTHPRRNSPRSSLACLRARLSLRKETDAFRTATQRACERLPPSLFLDGVLNAWTNGFVVPAIVRLVRRAPDGTATNIGIFRPPDRGSTARRDGGREERSSSPYELRRSVPTRPHATEWDLDASRNRRPNPSERNREPSSDVPPRGVDRARSVGRATSLRKGKEGSRRVPASLFPPPGLHDAVAPRGTRRLLSVAKPLRFRASRAARGRVRFIGFDRHDRRCFKRHVCRRSMTRKDGRRLPVVHFNNLSTRFDGRFPDVRTVDGSNVGTARHQKRVPGIIRMSP